MVANSDDRRAGLNGAVVLGGALPSPGTLVAAKTQWDLSLQRDYYDASAFGDSNKQWRPGLRDTQGTYAGLLDLSGGRIIKLRAKLILTLRIIQKLLELRTGSVVGNFAQETLTKSPGFGIGGLKLLYRLLDVLDAELLAQG